MKAIAIITGAACAIFLSSCVGYKPYLEASNVNAERLSEKIIPDKRYELLVVGGKKVRIRVDSVLTDRIVGDTYISGQPGSRQNDNVIFFRQIMSVKERKVNVPLTIGAVGAVAAGLVIWSTSDFLFADWNFPVF